MFPGSRSNRLYASRSARERLQARKKNLQSVVHSVIIYQIYWDTDFSEFRRLVEPDHESDESCSCVANVLLMCP
jgi:hypothetical protein